MKMWAENYPELVKSFPQLQRPRDVWGFVKPGAIKVGDQMSERGVAIEFQWAWDDEHEYELWFHRRELIGEDPP